MNAKILVLLIVGISFLFFGCAKQGTGVPAAGGNQGVVSVPEQEIPEEGQVMPGSDRDEHGCIPSAGYSWCEVKRKCLRTWEEPCVAETNRTNISEEQLADLFQIETNEPFGTEGLDTQTPSAQSNSS